MDGVLGHSKTFMLMKSSCGRRTPYESSLTLVDIGGQSRYSGRWRKIVPCWWPDQRLSNILRNVSSPTTKKKATTSHLVTLLRLLGRPNLQVAFLSNGEASGPTILLGFLHASSSERSSSSRWGFSSLAQFLGYITCSGWCFSLGWVVGQGGRSYRISEQSNRPGGLDLSSLDTPW